MSHPEQLAFFAMLADVNANLIAEAKVLEVGSYDVNGSIRSIFSCAKEYTGVDLTEGPGVDVVSFGHELTHPDGHYDITISSECFEHDPHWRDTFVNMARMTRPGGILGFSCASLGRVEHGTTRSDTRLSPGTHSRGMDYYRNLNERDFQTLDLDAIFSSYKFWYLPTHCDLLFVGIKHGADIGARIPTDATVNRLEDLMSEPYKALMAPFRGLARVLPDSRYQTVALPLWKASAPAIQFFEFRRLNPADKSLTPLLPKGLANRLRKIRDKARGADRSASVDTPS